jgi:hypothetical protein
MESTPITFLDDAYLIEDSIEAIKETKDSSIQQSGLSYSLVPLKYYRPPILPHLRYPYRLPSGMRPYAKILAFEQAHPPSHYIMRTHYLPRMRLAIIGVGYEIHANGKILGTVIGIKSVELGTLTYLIQGERGKESTLIVPKRFWSVNLTNSLWTPNTNLNAARRWKAITSIWRKNTKEWKSFKEFRKHTVVLGRIRDDWKRNNY